MCNHTGFRSAEEQPEAPLTPPPPADHTKLDSIVHVQYTAPVRALQLQPSFYITMGCQCGHACHALHIHGRGVLPPDYYGQVRQAAGAGGGKKKEQADGLWQPILHSYNPFTGKTAAKLPYARAIELSADELQVRDRAVAEARREAEQRAGTSIPVAKSAACAAAQARQSITLAGFGATASHYAQLSYSCGDGGLIALDPDCMYPKEASRMAGHIVAHGQDGRACLRDAGSGFVITALADGHGRKGELWSRYALLLLPCKILEHVETILSAASSSADAGATIANAMDAAFREVDRHLRTECVYTRGIERGGSTMTVSVKFPHPTIPLAVGSITSNVGDSPLVRMMVEGVHDASVNTETCATTTAAEPSTLASPDAPPIDHAPAPAPAAHAPALPRLPAVVELTGDLSAESPYGYGRYVHEALEKGLSPEPAVLSRFNTVAGKAERPDITDDAGTPIPIPIFGYTVTRSSGGDLLSTNVFPCTEKMQAFYEGELASSGQCGAGIAIGGPQTRALRERFIAARARGECPSFNWGCTLNGGVQPVSSFGDASLHNGEVMPVDTSYEVLRRGGGCGGGSNAGGVWRNGDRNGAHTVANGSSGNTMVVEVMGSDGLFDVLTHAEIAEAVVEGQRRAALAAASTPSKHHEDATPPATQAVGDMCEFSTDGGDVVTPARVPAPVAAGYILDVIWGKLMEVVSSLQRHDPFKTVDGVMFDVVGIKDNNPTWDDVSLWVTTIEL